MFKIDFWEILKSSFPVMWSMIKDLWMIWIIVLIAILFRLFFDFGFKEWKIQRRKLFGNKPTKEAEVLGNLLMNYGWKVEFEKYDGHKHIDIAITEAKVDIEVDGAQHNLNQDQAFRDLERTYYSFRKGYVTLRIPNVLVRDSEAIKKTAEFIDKFLRVSEEQLGKYKHY